MKAEIEECEMNKIETEDIVIKYNDVLILNKKQEIELMNEFKFVSNAMTDRIEILKQNLIKEIN